MAWWNTVGAKAGIDGDSHRPGGKKNSLKHIIDYQYLLFGRFLILNGWAHHSESDEFELQLVEGSNRQVESSDYRYTRLDVASIHGSLQGNRWGFVLIADLKGISSEKSALTLSIECQDETDREKIQFIITDDARLVFPILDRVGNQLAEGFKSTLIGGAPASELPAIFSHSVSVEYFEKLGIVHIDRAIVLPDGLFLDGWMNDYNGQLMALYLIVNGQIKGDIKSGLARYLRPDITGSISYLPADFRAGIYTYFGLTEDLVTNVECLCVFKDGSVYFSRINLENPNQNEIEISRAILQHVDSRGGDLPDLFDRQIDPSLQSLWKKRLQQTDPRAVTEFGRVDDPTCSLIVPIYGRYDFLLHQVAQFASDPEFNQTELIYVLDDPPIETEFMDLCADAYEIFKVPFKVIANSVNLGFAGANNVGVRHARSSTLVLMNSDVLPGEPGWLVRLNDLYRSLDNPGALGVKLLFDDETIQHVGMDFIKHPKIRNIWLNDHPFKGMPVWALDEREPVAEISCVTAACMMISKAAYEAAGGFDTRYILGDFEDSDLCLNLLQKGYKNYIANDIWLYHLERQSQSHLDTGDWKLKLTLYNGWQHTRRWGETIDSLSRKTAQ